MKNTEAKIVDNNLVMSLPNAIMPGLWRTDFSKLKDALFFIEETGKTFSLKIREGSKKAQEIATFETKEKAVEALEALNAALLVGDDTPPLAAKSFQKPQTQEKKGSALKRLIQVILVLFIVFVAVSLLKPVGQGTGTNGQSTQSQLQSNGNTSPNSNVQTGVPLSADDFFGE